METKLQNDKINKPAIKSSNLFPVVGIGASAGGLDAFKKLLKAIPEDSGMAYVLVQHLDPNHESMLPEILQKVTKIPVLEITDDIKVHPDHIYVIPSNKMMVATDGILVLAPRPPKSTTERNLPIDLFFVSLAEVHQEHAIGVVLSGTASDGTQGLKAIKENGGITFAQDEASAEYEGMPHSAAEAGVVDFILPPEEIPKKLLEVTSKIGRSDEDLQNIPKHEEDVFKQILSLLRIRKGVDFTYYKQTTIRRRILRRMVVNKNEEAADYLKYLRGSTAEQDLLYQDMLIPVTSFFRDKKTFDNLCTDVFPAILKNKIPGEITRIWVAGCSTGQEVYSFAMCFKEFLGDDHERIQIFGTDLSEPAIAKARSGLYEINELDSVSPQRLKEYFTKSNGGYQVNKSIRDLCIFAHHNFLKDPPFGKMDCISCRNVLIYMEPYLQKKALTTFHYALNPKGFLLLGKSETTGGVPDLYAPASKTDKLYTRKDVTGRFMPVTSHRSEQILSRSTENSKTENIRTDFQKTADDILLSKYTPAGVVINEAMDIVHFRGNTSNYLEQAPGKPSHNLLMMAKHGLGFELRNILHKAKTDKAAVVKENIPVQVSERLRNISIEAIPLPNTVEPYYMVLFHDYNVTDTDGPSTGSGVKVSSKKVSHKVKQDEKDLRIKLLEQELSQIREDMRSITEEQEASNEELQSANEELLSSSEELQSLNEELETSKEELQSTNEELTVLNHELIGLNEQVTDARNYSESIVKTLYQPLLVLDKNLRVKTANEAFYNAFHVNEKETEGVLIYDLGNRQWNIPQLRTLLEEILPQKKQITDFEVTHNFQSIGERVILLSALELTRERKEEKLILLSIEDITERKQAVKKIEENEKQLQNIFMNAPAAIAIFEGPEYKYILANKAYENLSNRKAADLLGKKMQDLFPELKGTGILEIYKKVYETGESFSSPENALMVDLKNVGVLQQCYFNFSMEPLKNHSGEIYALMAISYDITEQVETRNKIEESEKQQAFLLHFSDTLRAETTVDAAANRALQMLSEHLKLDRCYIGVYHLAEDSGVFPYQIGNDRVPPMPASVRLSDFPDALRVAFDRTLVIDDVTKAKGLADTDRQNLGALGLCALIAATLRRGEVNPLWSIVAVSASARQWTLSEVKLIEEVTERTWAAVERAKSEEALKQSEEKYRTLFTNIEQGFSLCDVIRNKEGKVIDMCIREVNPTYEKQTGLNKEIVIDKPLLQVFPSLNKELATYAAVVDNQKAVEFEQYFENTDRWFAINAYPVEKEKFAVLFSDITERKRTEEKIKESELRFQTAVAAVEGIVWTNNAAGEMEGEQIGWSLLTGQSYEEYQGYGWLDAIHPDDAQPTLDAWNDAVKNHTNFIFEHRVKIKNDTWEYFSIKAVPLLNSEGLVMEWVGVHTNISERYKAEKAIKESENQFRQMAELMPQKVWTADASGYKNYFNTTLLDYSGHSFEELKGSGWQKIIHPDDWEINKELWEESLRTGQDYEADNRLLRKDGKYLWHLTRAVAIKDITGKIKMWVGSKTEIEEHRKHSQDLEVAKNDAEFKRKLAEDAMKAKQQFLSNMSHEIRTPMNAIVGFTNVLTKTALNKNQKEYINAIKTSADALIFLINDILDLAKVDSGKMTFEQAPFELNITMYNIIQLFEPKAQEKNLKLEILYDPALPKVLIGDQMRLRQVLLNLVSNSMKFTSEGKIVLEAKLLEEDQESAIIEISITDTGIGIAANRLERIFEDFEQAAYENSRLYGGTGLGLSIVKKLILLQGGTINVESVLGKGSTFSVKQKFGKIKIIKPIEELAKIQNSIPLKIENIKILVAEDVALNQLLIKIILLDFGFEIFIAENGKIAIEQLQKDKYDIVLMDLQMPIMNGFEATDFIRNNMKSTIPIIALTADVTTADVDKCIAMGMNDYISKPIDEVLLFDKILKLLPNF